jgi:hypothetical protein
VLGGGPGEDGAGHSSLWRRGGPRRRRRAHTLPRAPAAWRDARVAPRLPAAPSPRAPR